MPGMSAPGARTSHARPDFIQITSTATVARGGLRSAPLCTRVHIGFVDLDGHFGRRAKRLRIRKIQRAWGREISHRRQPDSTAIDTIHGKIPSKSAQSELRLRARNRRWVGGMFFGTKDRPPRSPFHRDRREPGPAPDLGDDQFALDTFPVMSHAPRVHDHHATDGVLHTTGLHRSALTGRDAVEPRSGAMTFRAWHGEL
jgi:hypothetical protein